MVFSVSSGAIIIKSASSSMTITRKGSVFSPFNFHLGVVIGDVARADLREHVITLVHFTRHPLQRADDAVHFHDHRPSRMRHAVITGQLYALGVNQHRRRSSGVLYSKIQVKIEFTQTDLPEPVVPAMSMCGMFFDTGNDGMPATSRPSAKASGFLFLLKTFAFQNIAQCHKSHFFIWHFDAHITMTRHRRLNTDARRG
jgi:hypothetical protein